MRILVDRKEIEGAQQALEHAVLSVATEQVLTRIGYPSGYLDAPVYWIAAAGLWAYFSSPSEEKAPGKYWNAFGLGKPDTVVNIVCEINPPVHGIYRRCAGAFAQSGEDLYILHRGNFNAYRGAIRKDFTRNNFDGKWIDVDDGDRCSELLRVGKLPDPKFVHDLRDFVQAVSRLKDRYRSRR